MITYGWRRELSAAEAAEVRALVAAAADYDDEAGFSRVRPVGSGVREEGVHQLVVRYRPADTTDDDPEQWPIAAYLRLDVDPSGLGHAQFVVHPDYRSIGVATLTFEKLGLPPASDDRWWGTGATALQAWAHGDHPAADRMARRFGAARVRRMWKLVRPLKRADDADVLEGAGITVRPGDESDARLLAERAEHGRNGQESVSPRGREHLLADSEVLVAESTSGSPLGLIRIAAASGNGKPDSASGTILTLVLDPDAPARDAGRALLRTGIDRLRQRGARYTLLYIDAESELAVQLTRELSFEQDRCDVCYQVPHHR